MKILYIKTYGVQLNWLIRAIFCTLSWRWTFWVISHMVWAGYSLLQLPDLYQECWSMSQIVSYFIIPVPQWWAKWISWPFDPSLAFYQLLPYYLCALMACCLCLGVSCLWYWLIFPFSPSQCSLGKRSLDHLYFVRSWYSSCTVRLHRYKLSPKNDQRTTPKPTPLHEKPLGL